MCSFLNIFKTLIVVWIFLSGRISGGVVPPPWADVKQNPCAILPRGWQLIYWAPHKTCYRIFQIGFPCADTMELVPGGKTGTVAQCRCPPGTASLENETVCYPLFDRGPCLKGEHLAPLPDKPDGSRIAECRKTIACPNDNQIWWAKDSECYDRMSQGPCPRGLLLTDTGCRCDATDPAFSGRVWRARRRQPRHQHQCFEPYTRGPCTGAGHLFLPGGSCGCSPDMPHYHPHTDRCYMLGEVGPCSRGHRFQLVANRTRAECLCKPGYVFWIPDGACYRLFTQGPCEEGQFLLNSTTCLDVPCVKGRLYLPSHEACYRIGSRGPCPVGSVVAFDLTSRPSVDGISYNGVCTMVSGVANSNQITTELSIQ